MIGVEVEEMKESMELRVGEYGKLGRGNKGSDWSRYRGSQY